MCWIPPHKPLCSGQDCCKRDVFSRVFSVTPVRTHCSKGLADITLPLEQCILFQGETSGGPFSAKPVRHKFLEVCPAKSCLWNVFLRFSENPWLYFPAISVETANSRIRSELPRLPEELSSDQLRFQTAQIKPSSKTGS